ncbi:MAG TPA: hypothetical protein VNA25_03055 [Phycisphaerae bacterium]|nr:hypothetical protein [Phycisphaerae bacterium]
MGIMEPAFVFFLHLAAVFLDMLFVLILVRFLRRVWSNRLLAALDSAARPVVSVLKDMAERLWLRFGTRERLSENGKLAAALLLLFVTRMLLGVGWVLPR